MIRTASFSLDRRYRYRLDRRWGSGPVLPWIMLNPSAADDHGDDPTIRRVIEFSRSWGFGGCTVVNLFAFRCAHPSDLRIVHEPIGRRNGAAVRTAIDDAAMSGADRIVVGWGVHGQRWLADDGHRGQQARRLVTRASARWSDRAMSAVMLGATTGGAPRHPLYVRGTTRPQLLEVALIRATS